MRTDTLSHSVSQLQDRRILLEKQLREVDERLGTIARILSANGEAPAAAEADAPAADATAKAAPAKATKATKTTKARRMQRWFDDGEAVKLMKRLVRAPMLTAEIVKALTHAKGHETAAPAVRKKFQAAAYMAVANAVKAGHAKRLKDGRVKPA